MDLGTPEGMSLSATSTESLKSFIAEGGLVGVVMCNSRPLKPAPGGAERLTGHNALAIALPSTDPHPFVTDLEPNGAAGDPAAAIAGMLLPNIAAKGFGLAAAIDLLCGG